MKDLTTKLIAIALLLVLFTVTAFSQAPTRANAAEISKQAKTTKSELPKDVTDAFYKEYPITTEADWYRFPAYDYQNDWWDNWYEYNPIASPYSSDYYAAEFTKDETTHKVIYYKDGKLVAMHKKLKKDVPKPVLDAIANSIYKTWRLGKEKEEIFKDREKMKVYKIEVENGKEKHALFYQQDGKLLKDRKIS